MGPRGRLDLLLYSRQPEPFNAMTTSSSGPRFKIVLANVNLSLKASYRKQIDSTYFDLGALSSSRGKFAVDSVFDHSCCYYYCLMLFFPC